MIHLRVKRRILIVLSMFLILFTALIVRLCFITFSMSDFINEKAYELWTREIPVKNGRGSIYDCNGNLIVGNELCLSIASINRQIDNKEEAALRISRCLDCDSSLILDHLNKNNSIELIHPEGRRLSIETAKSIMDLDIEGIYLVADAKRYYPYDDLLGPSLGFCGIDGDGLAGLEYIYNDYLKQTNGSLNIYTDAKGNSMPGMVNTYDASEKGNDIYLTVDINVEQIVDNLISKVVDLYQPEDVICLVSKVKTGEVLAISQYPSFEPAHYQDYDQSIYNRNLPIWMSYEPGSTFKIVTYSAGLQEKKFTFNENFYCPGYKEVAGQTIHCWKRKGHGSETFLEVIQNSCNPGFMTIGERLGIDTFYSYLTNYGFGEKTGIDLLGESSGIIFNKDNMGPVELATSSFGQGNSVTPIQLVQAMGACVNGGNLMTPYVLSKVDDNEGKTIYQNEPITKRRVISEETSELMRYALECVVAQGTGRNAFVEGYRVGGKTGTAQKVGENGGYMTNNYILSFLGAAPMNDPEIAIYIAIDHPKNCVNYGGVIAAPLVGELMSQILPYLGIQKDFDNQIEKEYRYYIDTKYYEVPNYVGLYKKEIKKESYFDYVFVGEGDKIIGQSPDPKERIKEGGTVVLYLGE